jgi:hypothetical protein
MYFSSKKNRSRMGPVLFEKLQYMERNTETQVNMTTFAEISAIKKTAEKWDMTMVTSGE